MRRSAGILALGALALLLVGCTPGTPTPSGSATPPEPSSAASPSATPSPDPVTRPARADLALSPDGMGTLEFGVAPPSDPALAMIVLEPDWCSDAATGYGAGVAPGTPDAALWVPIAEYRGPDDPRAFDFGVHVAGGVLDRIDLYDATIPTTEGIRIGAHRAQVEAAYPSATRTTEWATDIYVVEGDRGTLQIEVARQPSDPYWTAAEVDTVRYIHAVQAGWPPFTVAASENIAGICPF